MASPHPIFSLNDAVEHVKLFPSEKVFEFSSPPHGLRTHGVPYFSALIAALAQQFPTHQFAFTLDAGEDAGLAMAALEAGFKHIGVSLPPPHVATLAALATHYHAKIFDKGERII